MRHTGLRSLIFFSAGVATVLAAIQLSAVDPVDAARYEELDLFTQTLHLVRRNYVEPVEESQLLRDAMQGMLSRLDPHSSILDPEAHREMQIDTRGEFHGIGIEISKDREGYIEVIAPIDGTPASRAGIRARDQIVAICPTEAPEDWTTPCASTMDMTLFEAVRLMRGKRGTELTIQIWRPGFETPQPFTIVRDVVKIVSVSGHIADGGYGYIRIRSFQERTARSLEEILVELRQESDGELPGLILDLRDNPGGLLQQAAEVADLWLSQGVIVSTRGRMESQRQDFGAHAPGTEGNYPMVVLVNAGSASASEIVAGALQDQGRALVLGNETFGKGSVQTVYPLEKDWALRLTTALYYTPAGRSIQEVGIHPDIEVDAEENPKPSPEDTARRTRERDLKRHFSHPDALQKLPKREDDADASEDGASDDAEPDPASDPDAEAEPQRDVQLSRAIDVLKSWTYFQRLERVRRAAAARTAAAQTDLPPAATTTAPPAANTGPTP